MTNEGQVNIIIARAKVMLPMMRSQLGDSVTGYAEYFKKSLLNMAEWKDQQFKEYLEKKKTELDGTRNKSNYELLDEIINELFKEG